MKTMQEITNNTMIEIRNGKFKEELNGKIIQKAKEIICSYGFSRKDVYTSTDKEMEKIILLEIKSEIEDGNIRVKAAWNNGNKKQRQIDICYQYKHLATISYTVECQQLEKQFGAAFYGLKDIREFKVLYVTPDSTIEKLIQALEDEDKKKYECEYEKIVTNRDVEKIENLMNNVLERYKNGEKVDMTDIQNISLTFSAYNTAIENMEE